jgi:hypothetical protein
MILTRRAWLPLVVAALVLAPATTAAASTPIPSGSPQSVVDLTFDVSVALWGEEFVAEGQSSFGHDEFVPEIFSRPTAAPMPPTSPLSLLGLKLTPGTTVVVSVFSDKLINDSACLTATSTRTATVVYLSTKTGRPSLQRPFDCARPGGKATVARPSKTVVANELQVNLGNDLRDASIAEQSYATDNNGAFIADTISRPTKAALSSKDPLVQQGANLNLGDKVVVTLFATTTPGDSYCMTGTSSKTHQVLFLSSADDTVTRHRPHGC